MQNKRFRTFSLGLVVYTVLVILWGAWVRISRSGAGCGEHWPLCNGELLPGTSVPATWIEFSHRISTGIYGILVAAIFVWALRLYPRKHAVVRMAAFAVLFTALEAWIGARLVLSGLVADDTSLHRTVFMALHQINSMFLSGSVYLIFVFSAYPTASSPFGRIFKTPRGGWLLLILLFPLIVSMSGAIASLASTLFPSTTLLEGWSKDFAADAHPVLRYRLWHPVLAVTLGVALIGALWPRVTGAEVSQGVLSARRSFIFLIGVNLLFGASTLLLLSPIWMKLTHLAMAHFIWFSALLLTAVSAHEWASTRR
jgi:heme a synthase